MHILFNSQIVMSNPEFFGKILTLDTDEQDDLHDTAESMMEGTKLLEMRTMIYRISELILTHPEAESMEKSNLIHCMSTVEKMTELVQLLSELKKK